MAPSDPPPPLDNADFPAALAEWGIKFTGREDSLDATWELAGIEERWGDSLFFGGESGCAGHYHAAMRALFPPGSVFSAREENDRRMEAYSRLSNKMYAVGPDGKSRPQHDAQPHPNFKPIVRPKDTAPVPPKPSIAERREAALRARQARTRQETELGRLLHQSGHHGHYSLGSMWLEAAKALALNHPTDAHYACEWSRHFFELYNQAWTAHLPASRWDSDGGSEMEEAQDLANSLDTGRPESPPPKWVRLLVDGNWQRARAAFAGEAPEPEFKPLAAILAEACQTAGKPLP